MKLWDFLYRQKQKIAYHCASNPVKKRLIEINQHHELIQINNVSYFIKELDLEVPKNTFDFLFSTRGFELLISNFYALNGTYNIIDDRLIFSFDDLNIIITSNSELSILKEIFVGHCYNFVLPKSKVKIVDIGMNVGISSLFFINHNQVEHVYAFEPFTPTYNLAIENFQLNRNLAKKITVFNFGLGYKEEELSVPYDNLNKGINSSLITNPRIQSNRMEKIRIKPAFDTIKEIIEKDPKKDYVIKIDTEGAEYDIIKSITGHKIIPNIKAILLEWHYSGPVSLEQSLSDYGFTLISTRINENAGYIYAFK